MHISIHIHYKNDNCTHTFINTHTHPHTHQLAVGISVSILGNFSIGTISVSMLIWLVFQSTFMWYRPKRRWCYCFSSLRGVLYRRILKLQFGVWLS